MLGFFLRRGFVRYSAASFSSATWNGFAERVSGHSTVLAAGIVGDNPHAANRTHSRHSQLLLLFPEPPLLPGTRFEILPLAFDFNFSDFSRALNLFFNFLFQPPKASDRAQVQSREIRLPDSLPISLDDQDVAIVSVAASQWTPIISKVSLYKI